MAIYTSPLVGSLMIALVCAIIAMHLPWLADQQTRVGGNLWGTNSTAGVQMSWSKVCRSARYTYRRRRNVNEADGKHHWAHWVKESLENKTFTGHLYRPTALIQLQCKNLEDARWSLIVSSSIVAVCFLIVIGVYYSAKCLADAERNRALRGILFFCLALATPLGFLSTKYYGHFKQLSAHDLTFFFDQDLPVLQIQAGYYFAFVGSSFSALAALCTMFARVSVYDSSSSPTKGTAEYSRPSSPATHQPPTSVYQV